MDLLHKIELFVLFHYGLLDKTCDKSKYIVSKKYGIANSINHNFEKIRIYSYNFFPIKK